WLVLYKTRKQAFCTVCFKKLNSFSKCGDDAFISIGMNNWKDCPGKLDVHEKSNYHRECVYKVHAYTSQVSVDVQLQQNKEIKQAINHSCFLEQLKCIQYLMRQGLIKGHTDDESNFQKLFELVSTSRHNKEIKQRLKKKCRYTSHNIINEKIKEMYRQAFLKLMDKVKQSEIFSVVIDETRDVSGHEQLMFAVRWVGNNYEVAVEFLGYGCTKMDATSLLNRIKDVLLQMGLDLKNIRGQTYDGASVLQGKTSGVATLLRTNPKALSIHCLNHSLTLVLQEAAKSCLMVRSALEAVHEVHNIIHASAK
uniref:DUF4371 domain-containing protein n=1 Tax=Latimeria chalumnae TaxID=7897 RepID=H2ZUI1_LATCH